MQEKNRDAIGIATLLPVHHMAPVKVEHAVRKRDLFREKIRAVANAIHWFPKLYEITHHNWWEEATIGPFIAYTPT